jgi:cytochrome c-type biogenesis protein CcmE
MPKNLRFVIGVSLVVAAVGYLITTAVRNTAEYYLTVSEAKARQAELSGQMVRIAGRVVPGTVQWDPAGLVLKFAITEPPPSQSGTTTVAAGVTTVAATTLAVPRFAVVSRGQPKPDMFAPGRDVIVEGRLTPDGKLEARQVLTSCPSKYSPKQD